MDRDKQIDDYVIGRMTKVEREAFVLEMKDDPSLKKDVEYRKNLIKVTVAENDDFRRVVDDFEEEARINKNKSGTLPVKWLAAASIALLLTLGYIFVFNQTQTPQDLFSKNFEPYPNVVAPNLRSSGEESPEKEAFEAYQNKDYKVAATLFTTLYDKTSESYYLFYKANALIQLNRAEEALPLLLEHLKYKDKLSDKTHWYLAMAYLQIDDALNAEKMLLKVVEGNEYDAASAKKLLKSLK